MYTITFLTSEMGSKKRLEKQKGKCENNCLRIHTYCVKGCKWYRCLRGKCEKVAKFKISCLSAPATMGAENEWSTIQGQLRKEECV